VQPLHRAKQVLDTAQLYMQHVSDPLSPAYLNADLLVQPKRMVHGGAGFAWAVQTLDQAAQPSSAKGPEGRAKYLHELVDSTVGEALALAFTRCREAVADAPSSGPDHGTPQRLCREAAALLRELDAQIQSHATASLTVQSWVHSSRSPADCALPAAGCAAGSGLPPPLPPQYAMDRSTVQRIVHNAHTDVASARLVAAELMQALSTCRGQLQEARQALHAAAKQQASSRALQLKLQAENVKLLKTGHDLTARLGEVMQQQANAVSASAAAAAAAPPRGSSPEQSRRQETTSPPRVDIPSLHSLDSPLGTTSSPRPCTVPASPLVSDFVLGTGGEAAVGARAPQGTAGSEAAEQGSMKLSQASPGRVMGGAGFGALPPVGSASSSADASPLPQHGFSALLGNLTAESHLQPQEHHTTASSGQRLVLDLAGSAEWADGAASEASPQDVPPLMAALEAGQLDSRSDASPNSLRSNSSAGSMHGDMFHSVQEADNVSM